MIPNFWCSHEVTAAELHLCFVIKGNVWWKSTFLSMGTIVKGIQASYTTCYWVVRQKRF